MIESALDKLNNKIKKLSDNDLLLVWNSLNERGFSPVEYFDEKNKITMEEWAGSMYAEKTSRGI